MAALFPGGRAVTWFTAGGAQVTNTAQRTLCRIVWRGNFSLPFLPLPSSCAFSIAAWPLVQDRDREAQQGTKGVKRST